MRHWFFLFIGYRTQEVAIKGKTTVNVTLQEDSQMLEEVVAIGYGAVPKRDLTGAVSSLKSEDLLKTNPVSINQGLQGKLAGVNVSQSDGARVPVSISRFVEQTRLLPVQNLCIL